MNLLQIIILKMKKKFTFASNELFAKRSSTSTSSVLTRRNGVFGFEFPFPFALLLSELFLVLFAFFAIGESPFSDNFLFLPANELFCTAGFSSSSSDESSLDDSGFGIVGFAKPPDTNFTGLKLFGVLVFVGDIVLAGVFAETDLFLPSSLSLSLESDDDDSFFFIVTDLFADTFGFFAASSSSESLLSSDDDLPLAVTFPFVTGALAGVGFFFAGSSSLESELELSFFATFGATNEKKNINLSISCYNLK